MGVIDDIGCLQAFEPVNQVRLNIVNNVLVQFCCQIHSLSQYIFL